MIEYPPDYRTGITIEAMINRSHINKLPSNATQEDWRKYNNSFVTESLTPRQLAVEIWNGFGFCAIGENNRRRKTSFLRTWVVALDFDTQDKHSAIDTIANHQLSQYFASFAYSTPSSTPDKPKSRLVFILESPITNRDRYDKLYKALLAEFPHADKSTKDVSRLFYGSLRCKVEGIWGFLPNKVVDFLIERHEEENARPEPAQQNTIEIDSVDCSRYVKKALDDELAKLRNCEKGGRHQQLLSSSFAMGSLVGAAWCNLSQHDAISAIMTACSHYNNQQEVERVANDGLVAGMAHPRNKPVKQVKLYNV